MSTGTAIAVSVLLLAANAFFVAAEFALVSARRTTIEPRARAGSRAAKTTLRAMENVSLMMAAAQLGITICSLGLGYLGEPAIAHLIEGPLQAIGIPSGFVHPIAFAIALSIVSFLHVVLGEMVPKNLALAGPDRAALALGPPLALVVHVMRPAIVALNAVANATLRLFGVTPQDEVTSAFTRDEVAGLVEESRREGLLDPHEGRLLVGALRFEERDARSVLLPTADLVTVDETVTPAALEQLAARTDYSRFPVSREGELIGYLHLKDVLEFEDEHRTRPIARSWIRPLPAVQQADRLRAILRTMQESGAHLAGVVGGAGDTVGVVALEDVLEELVGEIRDEAGRQPPARGSAAPAG
jgi:CBS domain containing-hemolysin-like protein